MMINVERNKVQFVLLQLLFGLCTIAFGCVVVAPNLSVKILGLAGVTAFVIFLLDIKNLRKNDAFWLCLVLLIIGICDLVWYRMYKVDSEAINSYRAYLEAGKIVNTHGVRGEVRIVPWADSAEFLRRFRNESKAVTSLRHPCIVK